MCYSIQKGPSYEDIKALITDKKVSTKLMNEIKKMFEGYIGSARRYGSIKTIADLIECLENLDVISAYNFDQLSIIEDILDDDEISQAIANYIKPSLEDGLNIYKLQRTRERNEKIEKPCEFTKPKVVSPTLSVPQFDDTKRKAVYDLIADGIGRSWRTLGRELGVKNGYLDMLEDKYRTDLKSRVYEIFELFEKDRRCERKKHFFQISEALDQCRRKDLRRDAEKIMLNEDLQ